MTDRPHLGLLVIDMQNAFCHPEGTLGLDGADLSHIRRIITPIARLIETCQRHEVPAFWSIQEHFERDAARDRHRVTPHTSKRFRPPALRSTWDSELIDELKPLVGDASIVFSKHRFGCFYNTQLETLLKIHGIDTLVITGATTNACVETTIREAYLRDFDIVAIENCIGGLKLEWHQSAVEVWSRFMCRVMSSSEFIEEYLGTRAGSPSLS
jgi:ureidoacrylate peracid hydrolase